MTTETVLVEPTALVSAAEFQRIIDFRERDEDARIELLERRIVKKMTKRPRANGMFTLEKPVPGRARRLPSRNFQRGLNLSRGSAGASPFPALRRLKQAFALPRALFASRR